MKKVFIVCLIVLMSLSLCACNKNENIVSEECDSFISYRNGYCSPGAGIMAMDFTLGYTGDEKFPDELEFSLSANDGLFTSRETDDYWFEEKTDCVSDVDYIWYWYSREMVSVDNGALVYADETQHSMYTGDGIYISVIAKADGNIIGYTVSKLYPFQSVPSSQITNDAYKAYFRIYQEVELESALFPMIDGKYQKISEEYVQDLINTAIENGADVIPEGYDELLALKNS